MARRKNPGYWAGRQRRVLLAKENERKERVRRQNMAIFNSLFPEKKYGDLWIEIRRSCLQLMPQENRTLVFSELQKLQKNIDFFCQAFRETDASTFCQAGKEFLEKAGFAEATEATRLLEFLKQKYLQ